MGIQIFIEPHLSYNIVLSMGERKAWTEQEDRILKSLYQQKKMGKWSQIARVMENQFNKPGRNGKQCRQRYYNHLDSSIKRDKWNQEEEAELIALHNTIGNRWAQISRAIPGRSENCVKNKFYSILRRGLKVINSTIKHKLKRYKQLDIGIVYKIVQACEGTYKKKSISKEMLENVQMKKEIIYFGMHDQDDCVRIKNLIDKIKNFSKSLNNRKQTINEKPSKKDEVSEDNITDLRTKKTSLQNFILEPIQQEHEEGGSETKISNAILSGLAKPKKLSSKQSNKSLDALQLKPYDLMPNESIKSFDLPQFDYSIRSPRPIYYGDSPSPYFDQIRPGASFNSWSQFYHQ